MMIMRYVFWNEKNTHTHTPHTPNHPPHTHTPTNQKQTKRNKNIFPWKKLVNDFQNVLGLKSKSLTKAISRISKFYRKGSQNLKKKSSRRAPFNSWRYFELCCICFCVKVIVQVWIYYDGATGVSSNYSSIDLKRNWL